MDSVARGVRFWQLVRLGVAGRAWVSLVGVFGGDVGRARMACGRCAFGRFVRISWARRHVRCNMLWRSVEAGVSREDGGLGAVVLRDVLGRRFCGRVS